MPVKITQAQSHKIKIRYCINSYCAFEGKNCNSELQPSLGTRSRTFRGDQKPQMAQVSSSVSIPMVLIFEPY